MKTNYFTLTDEDGRTIAVIINSDNDRQKFESDIIQAVLEHTGHTSAVMQEEPLNPENFIGEDKEIEMILYDEDDDRTEHTIRIESVIAYGEKSKVFQVQNGNGYVASSEQNPGALFSSSEDAEVYIKWLQDVCGLTDMDFSIKPF